ncbi:MAG: prepilin-type N-terminal cleavage/methylation domain-containing protein [Pseudohongiellaceae bacterium]|jgi:prepilin-type N-terminal cleavage/methylation domain-containing protein
MKMLNVKKMGGAAKQAGFTIIELVVVILLLGILTATALPRFLDISDDAHAAVVNAHMGSLSTGVALYRAAWFAKGKKKGVTLADRVDYLGDGITTADLFASQFGYPASLTASAIDPVSVPTTGNYPITNADCVGIFNGIMQDGGTALAASASVPGGSPYAAGTAPTGVIIANGATEWDLDNGSWAAQVIDSAASVSTVVTDVGCDFYYMGQFQSLAATPRVIRYYPQSGSLTLLTSVALTAI